MYCRNCGRPLLEGDRFCANCGSKVFKDTISMDKKSEEERDSFEQMSYGSEKKTADRFKVEPPSKDFKWDVYTFPGHQIKKTEDIDFDWGDIGMFKKIPDNQAEIAFGEDIGVLEEAEQETISDGPEREEETWEYAPGATEEQAQESAEEQALEAAEEEYTPEESTFAESLTEGLSEEEQKFEDAYLEETDQTSQTGVTEEELEKELFDDRKTTRIDKFYTFNKKNEEFQELLDKEYEKFKRGELLSEEGSETGKGVHGGEEDWPEFNPAEHIEEMARAREAFFDDEPEIAHEPKTDEKPEAIRSEETQPEAIRSEETQPEAMRPEEIHTEEPDRPAKAEKEDKWEAFENYSEEEKKEKKSGRKAGKIVITILVILLFIQVALLGVRFFAPESTVAQYVDEKAQVVLDLFK